MNIDNDLVQKLKDVWGNCDRATIEFANSVPSQKWHSKSFEPRFKSFAWEFACLVRTRICYLRAFKTGQLIFSPQADIPNQGELEKRPKEDVLKELKRLSSNLLKELGNVDTGEKVILVVWLLQHERLHQGKLLLYCAHLGLKLPPSFVETWGESNFPRKGL